MGVASGEAPAEADGDVGACAVCGAAGARRCAACRLVAYCGRQHQKEHWSTHKALCRPFEARQSATLGRHLVATRTLDAGACLFSETPLVAGPRIRDPAALCPGCLRAPDPSGMVRCNRCFLALCAGQCPAAANHAAECAVLRLDPQPLTPPYALLTPLRCLLLQRKHPQRWSQLMAFEAHIDQRGPTTEVYKELQSTVVGPLVSRYLSRLPEGTLPDISEGLVHRVCDILDVNAMEVRGESGLDCIAVYNTACLLEHSCIPNTRHTFDVDPTSPHHLRVNFRAGVHISSGEHISTMYTHALWGTQARRAHLQDTKYFSCICRRCADPSELGTNLSGLRCLGALGDGECEGTQLPAEPLNAVTDWRCNRCPAAVPGAHVEELLAHLGDEVDNVLAGNPTAPQLHALLEKLLQLLHPHHFHSFAVHHSLLQLLGRDLPPERLRWKAEKCRDMLHVCRTLDPGGARLSLYTAVLQLELSRAVVEMGDRGIGRGDSSAPPAAPVAAAAAAAEARSLLRAAARALEAEPRGSPGARYAQVVAEELRRVEAKVTATVPAAAASVANR